MHGGQDDDVVFLPHYVCV